MTKGRAIAILACEVIRDLLEGRCYACVAMGIARTLPHAAKEKVPIGYTTEGEPVFEGFGTTVN